MDDASFRMVIFLTIVVLMAGLEYAAPKRTLCLGYRRWPANFGLLVIDVLLVRMMLPAGAMGVAWWAQAHGWGLCNVLFSMRVPDAVLVLLAVILLDLLIYGQHVLFHAVPWLWRLHMVHHADRDIDVSTGLRFHPIEIVLSLLIKMAAVVVIGAPLLAVIIFEVLLNGMAMFNHANVRLPKRLDKLLRVLLITPDVHRIHHSIIPHETNSNYGFNLSVWDRCFGTYRAQPDKGHDGMVIGLAHLQDAPTHHLWFILGLPFQANSGGYGQALKPEPTKHRESQDGRD